MGPRLSTRASQPRLSALDGRERSETVRGAPRTPPAATPDGDSGNRPRHAREGKKRPGSRKREARAVGVDARNPRAGVGRRPRDAPRAEARKVRAVSCRRWVSWTGAGTAWTANRVRGGIFRQRAFASRAFLRTGGRFVWCVEKTPGASGGANRDAGLSTHLLLVVVVVVFSRALRLKMMNAGVVNRRSRGASRDGEDRRGIGRAMRRRKISCARNEKVDCPVRRGRTVLRAVLGVFARRSRPPSSAGRYGCVRGGGWDQERGERVRSAY